MSRLRTRPTGKATMVKVSIVKPRFDGRNWLRMFACAAAGGVVAGLVLAMVGGPSFEKISLIERSIGSAFAGAIVGGTGAILRTSFARLLTVLPLLWLLWGPIYFVFVWPGLKLGQELGFYSVKLAEVHIDSP